MANWSDLKYFLAMIEHGSLSAAARAEKVSQPTLSRRLTALEEDLGNDLFNRSVDGLQLTPTGARLVEHAERMKEEATSIERIAAGSDDRLAGRVIISSIETVGTEWLTHRLRPFSDQYDGVQLELQIDMASADLLRREADIAIRMYRPVEPDLIAKKVGKIAYGFFSTQDYIDRAGQPKDMQDICNHRLILPDQKVMEYLRDELAQFKIHLCPPVFSSNNTHALTAATLAGYGIGVHSSLTANMHPELIRVMPEVIRRNELWLVTHKDVNKSARIRAVYDYISNLFVEDKELFNIEDN